MDKDGFHKITSINNIIIAYAVILRVAFSNIGLSRVIYQV